MSLKVHVDRDRGSRTVSDKDKVTLPPQSSQPDTDKVNAHGKCQYRLDDEDCDEELGSVKDKYWYFVLKIIPLKCEK